jgi:hypothetical protein
MNTPIGFKERLGAELAVLERARSERAAGEMSGHGTQPAARRVWARPAVRRTALAGLAAAVAATVVATSSGPGAQDGPVRAVTVAQVLDAAAVSAAKGSGKEPALRQWVYTNTVTCEPICGHLSSWTRYDGSQGASVGKAFETRGRTAVLVSEIPDIFKRGKVGEQPRETWRVLSQLPTEPRELLARVSRDPFFAGGLDRSSPPTHSLDNRHDITDEPAPAVTPGARFSRILNILQSAPNIPPEVNAALYRALALIPGVELVDAPMKDAAGRPSLTISFGFRDRMRTREYLYLDPKTYAYHGYRTDWHGERAFSHSYARVTAGIVDHPGQVPGGPAPDPSSIVKMKPPTMFPGPIGD